MAARWERKRRSGAEKEERKMTINIQMHHGNLQKNSYAVEIYEMNRTAQK
jgi:hypothetical protein